MTLKDRRVPYGFGLAGSRREGGWNYELLRGGIERRKDSPGYKGFWESADEEAKSLAKTV